MVPSPSLMDIEAKPEICNATGHNYDPVVRHNPTQAGTADTIQEPFEGTEFESEESAKTFYIKYAKRMGFRARISRYGLSRHDNSIISRHIVCSKEDKSDANSEGKAKRPRVSSRVGCPAIIVVRLVNNGKWIITKFEKEHNHALSPRSKEKNCIPEEYKKVLYNMLHEQVMKFVAEGSASEEIYNVAIVALKEASDKVSLAKNNAAQKKISSDSSSSDHSSMESMSTPAVASSDECHQVVTTPIKAIPISSRPVKPGSLSADVHNNGTPVPTLSMIPQTTSLIYDTAITCGARVVPPNQALSIVKAIEAKITSGKAIVANPPVLHKCKTLSGRSNDCSSNENGEWRT